ncbi:MAG: glycerol-3-phosphate dehydrogenase [Gammaproteobacteria bacterium]|nr:glycerol-3-phosphate dehydrogenase [Gammaproteobacteria bacterium]
MQDKAADYDLVVIGAGINGAGIARDAATRGMRTLLLEKADIGGGTTSWSSRLIHGGLRYLEYAEIPLVFESLRERRLLQTLAPHLVKRLRLSIPIYSHGRRSRLIIRLGMIAYDLLSIGKSVPRHRMLSRDEMLALLPGLNADNLVGGAQYYDAQLRYAERLVVENVFAAHAAGAEVRTYSPVIGINVARGKLRSIEYADEKTGEEIEVTTRMAVNAAGPWVDRVLATVNREMPQFMGGTKGSHIVVDEFDSAPQDALYVEARSDGRPFFIIPWNRQILIGTTDIRYSGDPRDAVATEEEVEYLLEETNHVFPTAQLSKADVNYAYAGVRPLPKQKKGPESAITRKHIIEKHRLRANGLVSVIGGKLTTYRNLSEQVVDYAARKLGMNDARCLTDEVPLPGANGINTARRMLEKIPALSDDGRERLVDVYGGRAAAIADRAFATPELAEALDDGGTILAAEVGFAIEEEFAHTLVDILHRRMMIGLDAGHGAEVHAEVARLAAPYLDWSPQGIAEQIRQLEEYNRRLQVGSGP